MDCFYGACVYRGNFWNRQSFPRSYNNEINRLADDQIAGIWLSLRSHLRKKQYFLDRRLAGHQHSQAIDADTDA